MSSFLIPRKYKRKTFEESSTFCSYIKSKLQWKGIERTMLHWECKLKYPSLTYYSVHNHLIEKPFLSSSTISIYLENKTKKHDRTIETQFSKINLAIFFVFFFINIHLSFSSFRHTDKHTSWWWTINEQEYSNYIYILNLGKQMLALHKMLVSPC